MSSSFISDSTANKSITNGNGLAADATDHRRNGKSKSKCKETKGKNRSKAAKDSCWGVLCEEMLPMAESSNVRDNKFAKVGVAIDNSPAAVTTIPKTSLTSQLKSLERLAGEDI
jgi:hypothetical protein